ncbi:hypothetical protein ACGF3G_03705 [Streptomyces sp. NPDC048179]|uniref:hypothetical protein n=1 Tax=Streptomyces sp. NPDC048179 TaxID=3365506 RepID=UPI0037101605
MAKFLVILGSAATAVAACVAVIVVRTGEKGPDVDAFRRSAERSTFCAEAAPLDLSRSARLTGHDRRHVIEDLRELAPDDIEGEFDRLLAWYEHPQETERDRSKQASVRVGEFIERSCDGINLGGIRT